MVYFPPAESTLKHQTHLFGNDVYTVKMAKKYQMKLIYRKTFREFFEEKNAAPKCTFVSGRTEDYEHAQKLVENGQIRLPLTNKNPFNHLWKNATSIKSTSQINNIIRTSIFNNEETLAKWSSMPSGTTHDILKLHNHSMRLLTS
ncbi:hypothetical protein XELAEV_18033571mg, partial [Xenopus laevis]